MMLVAIMMMLMNLDGTIVQHLNGRCKVGNRRHGVECSRRKNKKREREEEERLPVIR